MSFDLSNVYEMCLPRLVLGRRFSEMAPQEFKLAEVFALDMALSLDLIKINSNK